MNGPDTGSDRQRSRLVMEMQADPSPAPRSHPRPEMTMRDAIAFVLFGTSLLAIASFFTRYGAFGYAWLGVVVLYFLIWPLPDFDAGVHDVDLDRQEARQDSEQAEVLQRDRMAREAGL